MSGCIIPASSEREKISFHQINKKTGNRIKYRRVHAETGDEVDLSDIVEGYEVGKGEYIEVEPEELEAIAMVVATVGRSIFDDEVLPLRVSQLPKTFAQSVEIGNVQKSLISFPARRCDGPCPPAAPAQRAATRPRRRAE